MIKASVAGAVCAVLGARPVSGQRKPPNIVFILADDLGYGDLGCYGQEKIKTPNLDAFAREGIRFTQCYAGSTVCAPSRCCLMTGLHTGHARVRGNKLAPLLAEDTTVAEVLKSAGYATALIGKWGLGEPDTTGVPNRKGFDYFFGYLNQSHAHNYYPEYLWRNEEKVAIDGNVESAGQKGYSTGRAQYSHDLFTHEAFDYVEQHKDGPFFLYLAYTVPHANNEGGRATGNGMEAPDYGAYAGENWPEPQKGHAAMISRLDRDVGALLQKLRDLGIEQDTVVFFSSDNGTHKEGGALPEFFKSSGPLRGIKRDLYDGGIRVPAMVRWPGRIAPRESGAVWAFWDFLPTAAALAGAPDRVPRGIDGQSIAAHLIEGVPVNHKPLYWEFHEGGYKRAARIGDWKGVLLEPDAPMELYDLSKDIGETNNVAEEYPEIVQQLEAFIKSARTPSELWPVKIP
jgi:arylsulfatase A-like enzyme